LFFYGSKKLVQIKRPILIEYLNDLNFLMLKKKIM